MQSSPSAIVLSLLDDPHAYLFPRFRLAWAVAQADTAVRETTAHKCTQIQLVAGGAVCELPRNSCSYRRRYANTLSPL